MILLQRIRARLRRGTAIALAALLFSTASLPAVVRADSAPDASAGQTTSQTTAPVSLPAVVASPPAATTTTSSTSSTQPSTGNGTAPVADTGSTTPSNSNGAQSSPATNKPSIVGTTSAPGATLNAPAPDNSSGSGSSAGNSTTVNNAVDSSAKSGNASVNNNGTAGSATSGSASATGTVVNVVNSNTGFGGGSNFTYYTKDIDANQTVQGNLLVDPSALTPVAGSNSTGAVQTTTSLTDILNNITLSATTGTATVSGNGTAGSATSGNASAIANIINVVNSQIGAKQTFLGVINIYGNLEGNILLPSSFVNGLLGPNAPLAGQTPATDTSTVNQTATTNITNNINQTATSGNATVAGNGTAGSATSGNAMTSLTVFNLTGQQVIAKNSLLVFVNVLGKWVGVIVNEPAGTTTAALGGGVIGANGASTPAGNSSATTNITNNVNVNATSGDANVVGNRKAGDAISGSATAAANILNISNTNFSLSDWFGVLFINVLGTWLGSVGIDTPPTTTGSDGSVSTEPIIQGVKAFRFNAPASFTATARKSSGGSGSLRTGTATIANVPATPVATVKADTGKVLGANTIHDRAAVAKFDTAALVMMVIAIALLLMAGGWTVRKRLMSRP